LAHYPGLRALRDRALPHGQHALTCRVRALQAWLEAAGLRDSAVFVSVTKGGHATATRLSDRDVARVVKAAVAAAGYDPAGFIRHSLRAGFATSTARAGVPEHAIMQHTRHRSAAVLRGYVRRGGLFLDNAVTKVVLRETTAQEGAGTGRGRGRRLRAALHAAEAHARSATSRGDTGARHGAVAAAGLPGQRVVH
jgi:hypothetical protein